ncbi:MAG: hypothetical protein Phog2KO_07330 [Phototrophicaceae bacterium]
MKQSKANTTIGNKEAVVILVNTDNPNPNIIMNGAYIECLGCCLFTQINSPDKNIIKAIWFSQL